MEMDGMRDDWRVHEIKEEIKSEDENEDECITDVKPNYNEMDQMYSGDQCCYFIQENTSTFDFKEETEIESENTSFQDESNDLKLESVKTEPGENEIVIKEDPVVLKNVYIDENDEVRDNENVRRKPLKRNRGRYSAYSLFLSSTNDNRDSKVENIVEDVSNDLEVADPKFTYKKKRRYACSTCIRYYSTEAALKAHLEEQICNAERTFECAICSSKFNRKRGLETHIIRSHIDDSRFKCEVCHRTFRKESNLVTHQKRHAITNNLYTCEICDKSFTEKNYLYFHKRVHSSVRPFICEVCNMSFKFKQTLKTHMVVHLDDESQVQPSFSCKLCSQSFIRKTHLKKHVRAHAYQQLKFALCTNNRA